MYGGFRCITLTFGSTLPLLDDQRVNDVMSRVGGIDESVDSVSISSGRLFTSYYALIGWVILVTICLLAFVIATLTRWKHRSRKDNNTDVVADDSISYTSSASDNHSVATANKIGQC